VEEAITRLSRVGFDNTIGYLKGGFDTWRTAGKEVDTLTSIPATALKAVLVDNVPVFDVRKASEYASEHIPAAENTPLSFLNQHLATFPAKENFYIHCAGGYRSVIAASILKNRGIHNIIDVAGGFKAIKEAEIPVSDYVCPSKL
jgi:rhodanese-related sulfurtransferase